MQKYYYSLIEKQKGLDKENKNKKHYTSSLQYFTIFDEYKEWIVNIKQVNNQIQFFIIGP